MTLDYGLFIADVDDRQLIDKLYQRYLSTYHLTPSQVLDWFSFGAEFADEDEVASWDEIVTEESGFRPNLRVMFYPTGSGESAMVNMLRFIGLILRNTPANAVLYVDYGTPMLLRKQGRVEIIEPDDYWLPVYIDALNEGMGIAETV